MEEEVDNLLLEEDCGSKNAVKMYQTCVDNKEGDVSLVKYSNDRLKCVDNQGNFIDCNIKLLFFFNLPIVYKLKRAGSNPRIFFPPKFILNKS